MSYDEKEEVVDLNYIKMDGKNEIELLSQEDIEMDKLNILFLVKEFEDENIGKNLSNYLRQVIPEGSDLFKTNLDYMKQYLKSIILDKNNLYISINRILSTDYKEKFIFNQENVQDICKLLCSSFKEIKKYKISNYKDFKEAIDKLDFTKYDFFKIYSNDDYLKNKERNDKNSLQSKSTTFSSYSAQIKDLFDEYNLNENNLLIELNRYHNEPKGIYYIDNESSVCSFFLNNNYIDYNFREEENIKILTKECFLYPEKNININKTELPIELILLLYKLKNVETLIFQVQNIDEQFIKMAIFILINIEWLFTSGIKEVKFDLGNDDLQIGMSEIYKERTYEFYQYHKKERSLVFNPDGYKSRTINLWEPETDIFFENIQKDDNKKVEFLYNIQSHEKTSSFDNHLCNIYNEFGNLTQLKYIKPFIQPIKDKINQFEKNEFDDFSIIDNDDLLIGDLNKIDNDIISLRHSKSLYQKNNLPNFNQDINNSNNKKKTTSKIITNFTIQYKDYFELIAIYSYFFTKNLKDLNKLCLYFNSSYNYEFFLLFNMKLNFDQSNFLILANKIGNLTVAEFSFNSLYDKSFEYILKIINKNLLLKSLKISFFTPDINYFEQSLFNLCSSKRISLTKLFEEKKEFEIKFNHNEEMKMIDFILTEKLFNSFSTNIYNFFNILNLLNQLEEFIIRLDIPLSLMNNEKYIILIIKFILNLFISLSFNNNIIHTFKILAPNLEFNCDNKPYIRKFFKELLPVDEKFEKSWEEKIKNEKDKLERMKMEEKENKLNDNKEGNQVLKKLNNKEDSPNLSKNEGNLKQTHSEKFNSNENDAKKQKEDKRKRTNSIDDVINENLQEINSNMKLNNITLQLKIYELPEIFNICLINNLNGLKYINLGTFDEITFIGFMISYKGIYHKLNNLTTLKIGLGISVTSYEDLESYILDYINLNPPNIEEKFLFSNLKLINEEKMEELFYLVYFKAIVNKLVIQISNKNIHMLTKVSFKYISESRTAMLSLMILMEKPEFIKLRVGKVLECLSSFYEKKKNRAIICK